MLSKVTLDFLVKLKKNNNREWFEKNKPTFLLMKSEVESLMEEVLKACSKTDASLKDIDSKKTVFRIYRDVRFSKDKSPYKSHMGAIISKGGKENKTTGFYIHIEPGGSFMAAGAWQPDAPLLKKIRQEIDYNTTDFKKIIANKKFQNYWGELENHRLSNPPKGYDKSHPDIELLKLTSYIFSHKINDAQLTGKTLVKEIADGYKIITPFLQFINTALE
ncbi:MAG: DUF2461 domain-containing protein [Bacteroidetes bacterium]|nr:DUF2461 domain-containing protein [Bacteroidota bacterium]